MFRFGAPEYFYLLVIIPVIVALYVIVQIRRNRNLKKFGEFTTVSQLMPDVSPRRVRNKFLLYIVALTLVIVALARPQFGSKLKEVTKRNIEIMIAVDVSNSMLAQDFEPNRLERTKFAIDRLLGQLKDDNIGIIVFAGDAYVQLPITSDYLAARNFVRNLAPNMVSLQGTAMGAAIDLASNSYTPGSEGSRILIVISDGENHEDDPIAAATAAAEKGIKIYTIGMGTPEGAPIMIDNEFMKDEQGNMVVSKLDEKVMEEIAMISGGSYIRASNQSIGLNEIIEQINQVEKKDTKTTVFEDFNEQYQYILAFALLLLLADMLMLSRKNKILKRFNIFK